jgi:tryptophanyl-tRNA synthetase
MKKTLLTGDRPTGRLHLGHYVGSIQNRIKLQNEVDQAFYMVADVQALTDNSENPEKVRLNVLEVALDNLACGVNPEKTTMFIQSEIPQIAELTVFFLNLVTVQRLGQNPTIKNEIRERGWNSNITAINLDANIKGVPAGFFVYPVSQAADILFCKSTIIPVGEDQKPVIEQCNEIVDSFNRIYGHTFERVNHVLSSTPRLVGTDGNAKMSKSLGNCIYLSDTKEEIKKKVMSMYTDPGHINKDLPGNIEGNVVFIYLDIFCKDTEKVNELKQHYKKGGLGDVAIKEYLIEVIEEIIAPIRERRNELAKNPEAVMEILKTGTEKTRKIAKEVMLEIRQKIKINYF